MKKALFTALLAVSVSAMAETPFDTFDVSKFEAFNANVTVRPAKDLQAACNAESVARGKKGFNYKLEACSFRRKEGNSWSCLVIVPERSDYWIIGHEMRHCFDPNFH